LFIVTYSYDVLRLLLLSQKLESQKTN